MSNHHLRNKELTLKAKGLLSQMLSLPENWDYTLKGLSLINREQIDAIREAVREPEKAGYIVRTRERDEKGRLRGADYVIYELPQIPKSDFGTIPTSKMRGAEARHFRECSHTPYACYGISFSTTTTVKTPHFSKRKEKSLRPLEKRPHPKAKRICNCQ